MSKKDPKLSDVLKPGSVLTDGNYDSVLSDSVLRSLQEWDKTNPGSGKKQGAVLQVSKHFNGSNSQQRNWEKKDKK